MNSKEYSEALLELWGEDELEFVKTIHQLHSTGDATLIKEAIELFHESVETLYMCV